MIIKHDEGQSPKRLDVLYTSIFYFYCHVHVHCTLIREKCIIQQLMKIFNLTPPLLPKSAPSNTNLFRVAHTPITAHILISTSYSEKYPNTLCSPLKSNNYYFSAQSTERTVFVLLHVVSIILFLQFVHFTDAKGKNKIGAPS